MAKTLQDVLAGPEKERSDTSLNAQAKRRAANAVPPKTLTAFEWERWYEEHGMPENFKTAERPAPAIVSSLCGSLRSALFRYPLRSRYTAVKQRFMQRLRRFLRKH